MGAGHPPITRRISQVTMKQQLCREVVMKRWECLICGFIYDEAEGWPEDGIAPGTPWEEVPEDWVCPDCGASKEDFDMVPIE